MFQHPLSLAEQLVHQMSIDIANGTITGANGRLPSEGDLCERYGVSRATVREALLKLDLAGAIIRRQGVGTFVRSSLQANPNMISSWLDEAPLFEDMIRRSGHEPACQLLSVTEAEAGRQAATLGLKSTDKVLLIVKRFEAGGVPIIHSRTRVPLRLLGGRNVSQLAVGQTCLPPIYHLLKNLADQRVEHQVSELQAVVADAQMAELLDCGPGAPLLRLEEVGYGQAQEALFHAEHHFRGDWASFRLIRRPTFAVLANGGAPAGNGQAAVEP